MFRELKHVILTNVKYSHDILNPIFSKFIEYDMSFSIACFPQCFGHYKTMVSSISEKSCFHKLICIPHNMPLNDLYKLQQFAHSSTFWLAMSSNIGASTVCAVYVLPMYINTSTAFTIKSIKSTVTNVMLLEQRESDVCCNVQNPDIMVKYLQQLKKQKAINLHSSLPQNSAIHSPDLIAAFISYNLFSTEKSTIVLNPIECSPKWHIQGKLGSQFSPVLSNPIFPLIHDSIPKKIHKVFVNGSMETIPEQIKSIAIASWHAMYPDYEIIIHDANTIPAYLSTHFGEEFLIAYNKLLPYAFKADFFRYCLMYLEGGIYSDLKQQILEYIPIAETSNTFIGVKEEHLPWSTQIIPGLQFTPIQNCFFACIPKHPYLRGAIELCLQNITFNRYNSFCTDVTGPVVFGRAIHAIKPLIGLQQETFYYFNEYKLDNCIQFYINTSAEKSSKHIIKHKFDDSAGGSWATHTEFDTNNYGLMWARGQIYTEPLKTPLVQWINNTHTYSKHWIAQLPNLIEISLSELTHCVPWFVSIIDYSQKMCGHLQSHINLYNFCMPIMEIYKTFAIIGNIYKINQSADILIPLVSTISECKSIVNSDTVKSSDELLVLLDAVCLQIQNNEHFQQSHISYNIIIPMSVPIKIIKQYIPKCNIIHNNLLPKTLILPDKINFIDTPNVKHVISLHGTQCVNNTYVFQYKYIKHLISTHAPIYIALSADDRLLKLELQLLTSII